MSDQADRLVELALRRYELGRSDDGLPFLVEKNGLRVARPMTRGGDLSKTLAAGFYDHFEGSVPSGAAITDAMSVLEGIALRSDQTTVFRRIAQVGEQIEVDLGDSTGRCVEVTPSGWRILDSPSELHLRTSLTGVLPNPVSGGSIEALRPLVNCDDDQFALAVGFLVGHFHVALQQPVLGITGEQGSAKSSLAGMIVDLGDPSPARLTTPPGSIRDWAIHASIRQLIAIDNVSSIPQWQSDCWCRAVSGDAFTTRTLYSDRELQLMIM